VTGPHFVGLREFFDQIDDAVESFLDPIAEGMVRVSVVWSRREECSPGVADGIAHVKLVQDTS
jgi:hypothetical protein